MYFSGLEKAWTVQALNHIPHSAGMLSFLEYSSDLWAACEQSGIQIAMDSGAFTRPLKPKDIDRYAEVIRKLGMRCAFYGNADVIGNQAQSNENYSCLLSLLPSELHCRVLWIYQSRAEWRYLEEGLERFSSIGIGGLKWLLKLREGEAILRQIALRVAQAGREAHYFGLGQRHLLQDLNEVHQGRFSSDASTWLVGAKYGRLIRSDGRQISAADAGLDFEPEEMLWQNVRTMQKWVKQEPLHKKKIENILQPVLF